GRFSHAVRLVCIKCTTCPTGRKDSRAIAIDETKVRLHDKHIFIYARDVDSKEVLVVRCSYTRSVIDAETQREVLEYCTVLISPWLL
ncbi:MAG: hypothetical protein RMJ59_08310, partial [Candidatus Nitrosocaldus sp.]|nr:hypothetical protein [Candidatus Nitrosocaldus sp.]